MKKIVALFLCFSLLAPAYSNTKGIKAPMTRAYLTSIAISSAITYFGLTFLNSDWFSYEIGIRDDELPFVTSNKSTLLKIGAIAGAIGCIIGTWLNLPLSANGKSLSDVIAINLMTSTVTGLVTGLGTIPIMYLLIKLSGEKHIDVIRMIEEHTFHKQARLIGIAYELHDNLSQHNQEVVTDTFFSQIQKENILDNFPIAQAYHSYKILLLRMNCLLEYVEKARDNDPTPAEQEELLKSEKRANDTIEKVEKALLCIKGHPDYYKEIENI